MTRRASFVLLSGLVAAVLPLIHPWPVSAASGVDDYPARLKNAPQDSLVDPWDFYNRECTSFVAWRLNSENQVPFNDYWLGAHWGNASNWKNAATSLNIPVDNNPTRGAVAWWAAGSAGSSRGHVAWVEAVGGGAITVEEYNYLREGFYDTRTISSSSSLWPSGFIHIKDVQIRNTASPTVTGTPQVGKRLVTTNGTWTSKGLTFAYQWFAGGKAVSGATAKSFTPAAAQLGKAIKARVTATKAGAHSGTASSATTATVARGVFVNSVIPVVAGTAQVGVPLGSTKGRWSPTGTFTYQWLAGGQPVDGATLPTFTPSADQLGQGLRVKVSLSAPGYTTLHVRSNPTTQVAPGQFSVQNAPTVSGVAQVDKPLTASAGAWSPAGAVSYQWLANGTPIAGATKASYTPTPSDLRKNMAIQVTVKQRGYTNAVATSVATMGVAPGTFLNTEAPSVVGTAQVGVPLKATQGAWSPKPTLGYRWLVNGVEVPGATGATYTPRPADLGKKISVEVSATRPGYLAATVPSGETEAVKPGVIVNHGVPVVTGQAVVGHALRTTDGAWSITPDSYRYQWYAGSTKIPGATSSTYQLTSAEAGFKVHVIVTAVSAGYTPLASTSDSTVPVVFGRVGSDRPTIGGQALVGHTLTARVTNVDPSTATSSFQWYRGGTAIKGATATTYVVQPADLGHTMHVMVTMSAQNWVTGVRRSLPTTAVLTVPRLHVHTTLRNGRVFLRLLVVSPGVTSPQGVVHVRVGPTHVGRFLVTAGRGSRLLAPIRSGTRTLTVTYRGGPDETLATRTVTVTIP